MDSKIIGYIVSGVGLLIAILSFNSANISFLSSIKPAYILIAGVAVIIVGVALTFKKQSNKIQQEKEEVPIYRGEGKNRKIVGYRKD